jgi:hypothetical protein
VIFLQLSSHQAAVDPKPLPAFVPLRPTAKRQTEAVAVIELSLGQKTLTVKWPTSDSEGCAR